MSSFFVRCMWVELSYSFAIFYNQISYLFLPRSILVFQHFTSVSLSSLKCGWIPILHSSKSSVFFYKQFCLYFVDDSCSIIFISSSWTCFHDCRIAVVGLILVGSECRWIFFFFFVTWNTDSQDDRISRPFTWSSSPRISPRSFKINTKFSVHSFLPLSLCRVDQLGFFFLFCLFSSISHLFIEFFGSFNAHILLLWFFFSLPPLCFISFRFLLEHRRRQEVRRVFNMRPRPAGGFKASISTSPAGHNLNELYPPTVRVQFSENGVNNAPTARVGESDLRSSHISQPSLIVPQLNLSNIAARTSSNKTSSARTLTSGRNSSTRFVCRYEYHSQIFGFFSCSEMNIETF